MPESVFYKILVKAGKDSKDGYDLSTDISSITWELSDAMPDRLTLHVPDPFKVFSPALGEGMFVEFSLGTDVLHEIVFVGRIFSIGTQITRAGLQALTINAEDRSAELGLHMPPGLSWKDKPLSSVIFDILKPYKFGTVNVNIDPDPTVNLVRKETTNLAFLQALAKSYGCTMFVTADDFTFSSLSGLVSLPPAFFFTHGRFGVENTLTEFTGHVDVRRTQSQLIFVAKENSMESPTIEPIPLPMPKDDFIDENRAAFGDKLKLQNLDSLRGGVTTAAGEMKKLRNGGETPQPERRSVELKSLKELELMAKNWASVNAHGMTGDGACAGLPQLRARSMIAIWDVGAQFSGIWYVSKVTHTLGADGFDTRFSCTR